MLKGVASVPRVKILLKYIGAAIVVAYSCGYAVLYAGDSYKMAVSALEKCASSKSSGVPIINPVGTSIEWRGGKGSAEYRIYYLGGAPGLSGGTVGLTLKDEVWTVTFVTLNGSPSGASQCL